ncbi:magnesium chelatase accessory protein [Roseovarius tolerans]|uniref:Magnesium chelatase accessory protein n=1 Tax=Roseovarius tolerans TaxID=74031 RepID=A0A1H7UB34_9RHOB|nr:alpha/beta fold hydrolase BchO [Roseovarius tolerans]SEL94280.1 magnesium chelatase accessory protein [Roseovarius tolerans]
MSGGADIPHDWPNRACSRRIRHRPHDWHVQEMGSGETLLLLHGAGASTHSWRDVLPRLAQQYHVVALDLPAQGFTRAGDRRRCGLVAMSTDIATLCDTQGWHPRAIMGHSAGAAIALDLSTRLTAPDGMPPMVIGLNAALDRFEGIAGWLFPVLARVLALNPLTATIFTMGGNPVNRARRLIEGTGSTLDPAGLALYARLISDRGHVDGTLRMMSQWEIDGLLERLERVTAPCHLITGENDLAVPPKVSDRTAERLPNCTVSHLPGLGHLAHEEDPERVCDLVELILSEPAPRIP